MAPFLSAIDKRLTSLTRLSDEDLLEDEHIYYSSLASWWGEIGMLALSGFLFLGFLAALGYYLAADANDSLILISGASLLAGLFLFFISVFGHYSTRYFVTDKRVMKREGLFSKNLDVVPYRNIQNVELKKKFTERIVDIGDIYIDVAGGPDVELVFDNYPDPEKPHKKIQELMWGAHRSPPKPPHMPA